MRSGVPSLALAVLLASISWLESEPQAATIEGLRQAIAEAEKVLWDGDDLAARSNLPLARLKLRKAELLLTPGKYIGPVHEAAAWEIQQGFAALLRLRNGEIAHTGAKGGFDWPFDSSRLGLTREQAGNLWPSYYEYGMDADNDGSPQPFLVEVPPDYDPSKSWPLAVYLHGYHGSVDMIRKWDTTAAIAAAAKRLGYLVLAPHGRSETDFLSIGETDVLQALRELQHFYKVDPERIYLIGGSMGGYGSLNLALHYPHLWAGVAAFTASTDMMRFGSLPRETLLPFRRWHYEWDNPIDLAGNAPSLPIFGVYGDKDTWVPPQHGDIFAEKRRSLGGSYEYQVVPGGGHPVGNAGPAYDQALEWFRDKRLNRWPTLVRHRTYSLRYDRSSWVRILGIKQWGEPAEIEAESKNNAVRVETKNVSAFEVTLGPPLVEVGKPLVILLNGRAQTAALLGETTISFEVEKVVPAPLRKTQKLCGPFEDVFNHPFLVVRGTIADDPKRKGPMTKMAEWFRQRWEAYSDGWPRMKDDVDVTDDDLARYGLLLLGRPSENALTARVAPGLPVKFSGDAFEVQGRVYEGQDVGLAMIYPNPLNPSHYVTILAGATYGQGLPVNHPFDLLPDCLVFKAQPVTRPEDGLSPVFGKPDTHLCAVFFDSAWQWDKKAMWIAD